ncbi:hypothetical protein AAVH_05774 [Aphelenchoides avenae]|nr:hypothetical protein AAVH_05774 [Aphelenchus avenae]
MCPSRKLFTQFDIFFAVLQWVDPDLLEKLRAVSRGWGATVDRHKKVLTRRRLNFFGHPTVVTVHMSRWTGEYEQVLRVLILHSPEQLSRMLCAHLRDAHVNIGFYSWDDFLLPPQNAMFRFDQSKTVDWTIRFFQSLKRTQVESVQLDYHVFDIDNFPVLMKAARASCRVGTFDLVNPLGYEEFTVHQVVDLLRGPTAVASDKIVVRTRFLDAKDTDNVISEFCLGLPEFGSAAFVDLPPTDRMKQFRQDFTKVTTRVHTYRNVRTGEVLSAVRHADDTRHRIILFLKGHIALDALRNKWTDNANDYYFNYYH